MEGLRMLQRDAMILLDAMGRKRRRKRGERRREKKRGKRGMKSLLNVVPPTFLTCRVNVIFLSSQW